MPPSRVVKQKLIERIRLSVHTLTVVFPEKRGVIAGSVVLTSPPAGLLTGTVTIPQAVPTTTPVVVRPPVTLRCLWLDVFAMSAAKTPRIDPAPVGYVAGAEFLARVEAEPTMMDGANTIFDSCDYVEKDGKRYAVLKTTPAGPSDDLPYSYYVWLGGDSKQ